MNARKAAEGFSTAQKARLRLAAWPGFYGLERVR